MKSIVFLFALICSSFASDVSVNTCAICQSVSGYLSTIIQNTQINEAVLEDALQQVCPVVTPLLHLPDETVCNSFIRTYGDALVNIIIQAQGISDNACILLGVCEDPTDQYKILDATYDSSFLMATYEASESDISSRMFYYKVFTGGLSVVDGSATVLELSVDGFENTALYITLVDENGVGSWFSPLSYGDYVEIDQPIVNSWYYITVNATFVGDWTSGPQGKFHIMVLYESPDNSPGSGTGMVSSVDHSSRKIISIIAIVLGSLLFCLTCCCCIRRMKRHCRRNGGGCCRKSNFCNSTTQSSQTPTVGNNTPASLELNNMNQTAPQQPIMYYYAPTATAPQQPFMYIMPTSDQVQYAPMQMAVQPQQNQ